MANEVTGKTLKLFVNAVEQAVTKVGFDRNFTLLDSTTSATVAPGMESVAGRAKSTINIEAPLLTALGAEIVTGTLTAGTKYLVTGGTIGTHAIGTIFTSDGTETASATNKAKPLGTMATGKDLAVTISGSTFACTDADYNVNYTELDSTTTGTASPNMEAVAGRAKITTKFDAIMYRATADLITNSAPVPVPIVLTLGSGITVTGNAILHQMQITDEYNGICKVTYNAEWQGMPVEVGVGYLTLATLQTADITYEAGAITDKGVTGNVMLLTKAITSTVAAEAKIVYTGVWNGAITPTIYA